ncbi:MAG: NAD(+)/NADH kinase [Candidatus Thermoplasmatota archaeon]|nr:NAD(+)/NADH kinase [Candidatus Thermoplasmatota archaeon]
MSLKFAVYGLLQEEYSEKISSLRSHPDVEEVYYETAMAEGISEEGYTLEELLKKDLDFIMTIGGDGTLLKLMQSSDVPALGVNTGTVGFLTSIEISEIDEALEKIERGDYFVDERFKLEVDLNGEKVGECTNEVVIHSDKIAKLREIETYYGENKIERFRADGLIVSTPTGSTCYAMSAGGPIVNPDLDVFVVVPISPFDIATKPHVVPTEKPMKVRLGEEEKACMVVLDGQEDFYIDHNDELEIHPSETRAKFIRFEDNFYDKIKEKLVSR